ncbi:DUF4349 domain-containing protein [Oceanicaulis sp. UBA2681]|uniref:DUF4349 domain-containing protein n=1 Tax=Oceanicaulis sp. UBA2681 TaxID=1947007 RepID=UPI000EEFD4C1|nr:DUF4349 domain-containing protein [Oceanicaulis sp. UBA2681]HCR66961.1 hypothetical protein [Oceanicaulis sp.]
MVRTTGLILIASAALVGCDQQSSYTTDSEGYMVDDMAMMEAPQAAPAPMRARSEAVTASGSGAAQTAPEDVSAPLLAYTYQTSLELPGEVLAATQAGHVAACQTASPATCQVIRAQVNNADGPRPSAYLQLRAAPDWIVEFRAGLEGETEELGGQVLSDQTSVEDLTTRIVDTAARVAAQTTLRDRLQQLLETRDGDLSDLLAVERELANVQASLDAQASVLAALRQRVNTSMLTLNYQAERQVVEPETFNPIGRAFKEMGEVFANSVASLILFLAGALPWLVIAVPVISGVVIGFRRLLRRKKAAS